MKRIILSFIIIAGIWVLPVGGQSKQKSAVLALSEKVISAIKTRNMNKLSTFVHSAKGVRFSPFSEITRNDQVFTRVQVVGLLKNKTRYRWGLYDESDRPIIGTFAKYYRQFVYDYNFAKPDEINYNTKRNVGIMINNIAKMYPKGVEVEYFIDGTEDKMYGCLRLIYEKLRGKWYLVGVVRDTPGI